MCLLSYLLSKVTVASCSFYIKCSMRPALLVDDAMCCYRSRLFAIVAFKTLTFHKAV